MKKSSLNKDRTEAREFQTATSGIFLKARKVLYNRESAFQKIEIIENRDYGRVLFLDGLLQTTDKDEFYYHEMLVHPALSSHPAPRKVLIIGGGDGGALREVLKHPVERAWMVEIDGLVIEACKKHFGWIKEPLAGGRAELVVGDGNVFIRETKEKFDVILVDSSDPVGPSTVLHEEGFYRQLRKKLRPGGIIAAQAGSLVLHLDQHAAKARFLGKMFKHVRFYLGPVPTYPVGTWCYTFLSDAADPAAKRTLRIPKGLKYYNPDIHRAAFALPNFLRSRLG
jgi:spermidine synthase